MTKPFSLLKKTHKSHGLSLSDYYPKGTVYFYSFPAGEDSGFYNQVPSYEEELVSGRPLICAGDNVKVLTFAACSQQSALNTVFSSVGSVSAENIIRLPEEITPQLKVQERNHLIKRALKTQLEDGKLVMAQPYLDESLNSKFEIDPHLSARLSNKNNMFMYVPSNYLPKILAKYSNGQAFYDDQTDYSLPCVVKVTASSSGDGVAICKSVDDIADAKQKFKNLSAAILVEQWVDSTYNLCVQFGISHDPVQPPTIIGFNEQITSDQGDFLGGIVNLNKKIPYFNKVKGVLCDTILPRLRELGWYGIGGIDVLIQQNGDFYFIDPNLRLTATYAYVYLAKTGQIHCPIMSFSGRFHGSVGEFEELVLSIVQEDNYLKIISMTTHEQTVRFNGGIEFDSTNDLSGKAKHLIDSGIESNVLQNVVNSGLNYRIK